MAFARPSKDERFFGGSATKLVMQVLGATKPKRAEIEQIRRLLEESKEDKK